MSRKKGIFDKVYGRGNFGMALIDSINGFVRLQE